MADELRFTLNTKTGRKILNRADTAKLINAAAEKVRRKAGRGARVVKYTTDRQAASVSVPAERQARDGALTRAAAAVGLTVKASQ